jgi:hypothetical protein
MKKLDLQSLKEIASKATPGPWGEWGCNYPFYVDVKKPAPSLSKHDSERPTYWRMEDALFVLNFHPGKVLELLDCIEELEKNANKNAKSCNLLAEEIDKLRIKLKSNKRKG